MLGSPQVQAALPPQDPTVDRQVRPRHSRLASSRGGGKVPKGTNPHGSTKLTWTADQEETWGHGRRGPQKRDGSCLWFGNSGGGGLGQEQPSPQQELSPSWGKAVETPPTACALLIKVKWCQT